MRSKDSSRGSSALWENPSRLRWLHRTATLDAEPQHLAYADHLVDVDTVRMNDRSAKHGEPGRNKFCSSDFQIWTDVHCQAAPRGPQNFPQAIHDARPSRRGRAGGFRIFRPGWG